MFRAAAFACAFLLCGGASVHADVIDLGNGLVYDTLQDLTWLKDTHYARTSGDDADGWMSQDDAIAWAGDLEFGGYDDWRLPLATPGGDLDDSSEVSKLLTQLGWHWSAWGDVQVGEVGPFLYFRDTPWPAVPMYWLGNESAAIWNETYGYDWRDGGGDAPAGVWAVRDGNPFARVPEPSTLMLVAAGAMLALRHRRRNAASLAR